MSPAVVRKVLVYCIADGRLLAMRHLDFPPEEVGVQVPGGTIRLGEEPCEAALRELREETGRDEFEIVAELGQATYDIRPYRNEVQERTFFAARPTTSMPERWRSAENHDGQGPATRLECFWIPLAQAHVLQAGQGALISRLNAS